MATGTQAITALAQATGFPLAAWKNVARQYQLQRPDWWTSAPGGAQTGAAEVTPKQLVRLSFGVLLSSRLFKVIPFTDEVFNLVPANKEKEIKLHPTLQKWKDNFGCSNKYTPLPGNTFGDMCSNLIEILSGPKHSVFTDLVLDLKIELIDFGPTPSVLLRLVLNRTISFDGGVIHPSYELEYSAKHVVNSSQEEVDNSKKQFQARYPAAVPQVTVLRQRLFMVMADLWSDTLKQRAWRGEAENTKADGAPPPPAPATSTRPANRQSEPHFQGPDYSLSHQEGSAGMQGGRSQERDPHDRHDEPPGAQRRRRADRSPSRAA